MTARRLLIALSLLAALVLPGPALAKGGGGARGKHGHSANWSPYAKRAKNGRIARSSAARDAFLRSKGITDGHTPKGYIVDHIVPLAAGGKDVPSNMRLITVAQENAQHAAEMRSARKPSGYNPYKYSGRNGALRGKSAGSATPHKHHTRKKH
jgi:hypothetical protein